MAQIFVYRDAESKLYFQYRNLPHEEELYNVLINLGAQKTSTGLTIVIPPNDLFSLQRLYNFGALDLMSIGFYRQLETANYTNIVEL